MREVVRMLLANSWDVILIIREVGHIVEKIIDKKKES